MLRTGERVVGKTRVWAWGDGLLGVLGTGQFDKVSQPTQVPVLATEEDDKVVQVKASWAQSYALTEQGKLYRWGWIEDDQSWGTLKRLRRLLGDDFVRMWRSVSAPIVGGLGVWGQSMSFSNMDVTPVSVKLRSADEGSSTEYDTFTSVESAGHKMYAVSAPDADGKNRVCTRIATFFGPEDSVFALPGERNVVSIAPSQSHWALLDSEGEVWSRGNNMYGQCMGGSDDDAHYTESLSSIQPKEEKKQRKPSIFDELDEDDNSDSLVTSGSSSTGIDLMIMNMLNVSDTFRRSVDTEAARSGDTLSHKVVQVCSTMRNTLVRTSDGRIWSCGWGPGMLNGDPDVMAHQIQPALIRAVGGPEDPVEQLATGTYHAVARTRGGKVYTWGLNYAAQLGQPRSRALLWWRERIEAMRKEMDQKFGEAGLKGRGKNLYELDESQRSEMFSTPPGEVHFAFPDGLRPARVFAGFHRTGILLDDKQTLYIFGAQKGPSEVIQPSRLRLPARVLDVSFGEAHALVLTEEAQAD